jgi:hypothetical protein
MSYKSEDKQMTVKAVKALLPVCLSPKWRNEPATLYWVKKGALFPGFIVEQALIEKSGGLLKANTNPKRTEDFDDYSDAKFLTVRERLNKGRCWCGMGSLSWDALKNKKGAIRLVLFERKQNRLYYFYIPRRAWRNYKNIDIPFHLNGDPKDTNHWWQWEVDSFIELARIKKEDWINVR